MGFREQANMPVVSNFPLGKLIENCTIDETNNTIPTDSQIHPAILTTG
jgi:hypothetical protein